MDRTTITRCILVSLILIWLNPGTANAWSNGQAADVVLGEPDFATTAGGSGASGLFATTGGCIDPVTQALWVVSYGANRALMWSTSDKVVSASAATKVLGQSTFTSMTAATTVNGLRSPVTCAVDADGNLYIADSGNNRVLGFRNAASKVNGDSADLVLGQADFISGSANRGGTVAANSFYYPWGLAVDSRGNLWVVDVANHRVLRFDDPMNKANGGDADFVLGQADFTSGITNRGTGMAAANTLATPQFIAVDTSETVLVSDSGNNRALRWDSVYSKSDGADADAVFGQADMSGRTSNRGGTAAVNTLAANVYGVAIDTYGGIYISDSGNNRVLYYNNGVSMASGDNADNVLGQVDFVTTSNLAASATSVGDFAIGIFLDDALGRLWVAGFDFNRATSFLDVTTADTTSPTMPTVTGSATTTSSTPTWNWTTNGGGNGIFRYKLDDTDLSTGATTTTGNSYTSSPLPNGAHTLYVQERDNAGNWSISGSFTTTINAAPPSAPTVTGVAQTQSTTPTWNWTANGGGNGTFRYKLDDSDLSSGSTETTATSYTPGIDLDSGAHILYVQERDDVGNWSVSGSFAITIAGLYYSIQNAETSMQDTGGSGATAPWSLLFLLLAWTIRQYSSQRRGR